ncbi:MAG TPA: hypothetical protein VGA77_09480 [Propylenella sp.]|jgi:hypothetical protein
MIGLLIACLLAMPVVTTPQAARREAPTQLAQATLGFICTTEFGSCPIPPQPVGSVCYCGETPGFVTE